MSVAYPFQGQLGLARVKPILFLPFPPRRVLPPGPARSFFQGVR